MGGIPNLALAMVLVHIQLFINRLLINVLTIPSLLGGNVSQVKLELEECSLRPLLTALKLGNNKTLPEAQRTKDVDSIT